MTKRTCKDHKVSGLTSFTLLRLPRGCALPNKNTPQNLNISTVLITSCQAFIFYFYYYFEGVGRGGESGMKERREDY